MHQSPLIRPDLVFLIILGFFASACSIMPVSSLETAAKYNNVNEARRHLNEGADVNKKDEQGQTPLHHAAYGGQKEVTEVLLERGAKVNAKDDEGRTPLHLASKNGHAPLVDLLLAQRAQVNSRDKKGRTPLHHAALGEKNDAALILISKRAIVDARDKKGWTPLYLACLNNLPKMAELLINKGARVNPTISSKGKEGKTITRAGPSPLIAATRDGHLQVVKVLLDYKARVHGPASAPKTPLHLAAEKEYPEIAKLLLEHKAKPNRRDRSGKTPIYYTTYKGNVHTMNVLIDHGVNVNQKIREGTLLHLASERGHTAVVDLLLRNDAMKLDTKNSKGKTALEVAMANGNQKAADLITRETVKRREVGKK